MSAARDILKNFNIFVDGRGYAGNIDSIQLPALNVQEEDFRAGGMDASIGLDMGMEKLELSFVLSKYDRDALAQWGLGNAETAVTLRGALESRDGTVTAVVVNARGNFKGVEFGEWAPGSKSSITFNATLTYYKYTQGGTVVHEIDVINMIRRIGGVDRLAAQRAAIGL
jgi:P2 family phage contractile tail tube protein